MKNTFFYNYNKLYFVLNRIMDIILERGKLCKY